MHAGLALAPPRESVLRDGLQQQQQQQQQPTISLLLERRDEVSGERFTSLAVAPNETIQSVKLRVSKRSAFTSRHCLVGAAVHRPCVQQWAGKHQQLHSGRGMTGKLRTSLMANRCWVTASCWRTT